MPSANARMTNYSFWLTSIPANSCIPLIQEAGFMKDAQLICIGAEDVHKNLDTLAYVWKQLGDRGATRHSLLVNLGGGMVTDLGGLQPQHSSAGIKYINVPTTLLAMVDASVGGNQNNLPG